MCVCYETLKERSQIVGLKIKVVKMKVLGVNTAQRLGQNSIIDVDNIQVVSDFAYLGSKVNQPIITSHRRIKNEGN